MHICRNLWAKTCFCLQKLARSEISRNKIRLEIYICIIYTSNLGLGIAVSVGEREGAREGARESTEGAL